MHNLLLFLLIHATFFFAAGLGGSPCNRQCGGGAPFPYPFGFSGDCPILLICNETTSMALLPHSTAAAAYPILSFNSTTSTFLATVAPSCNRTIRDAEASLMGAGYGVSSRTGLFLRGGGASCRVPKGAGVNCTATADIMTRILRTTQCLDGGGGGNETAWTCISALPGGAPAPAPSGGGPGQLEFLPWKVVSASGCQDALTAVVYGVDMVQGQPSLQYGVAELGWWLNGTCAAAGRSSCAPNATCHDVETPTGAPGHKCTCQYGMIGDGYAAGDGCHNAKPASRLLANVIRTLVPIVFFAFVLSIVPASCFLRWRRNRQKTIAKQRHKPARLFRGEPVEDDFEQGEIGPRQFSYDDLVAATGSFSDDRRIGKGGFGSVYEGYLTDTNRYVAVKRVSATSRQGWKEFAAEVRIISRLRHRNLVQLIGWCHDGDDELLLVYELLHHGSLNAHLYNNTSAGYGARTRTATTGRPSGKPSMCCGSRRRRRACLHLRPAGWLFPCVIGRSRDPWQRWHRH